MSWFDDVTGTNDYERQSWRDNYNDGRAAGDWTGNVNARLDREREASGGFTNSGSSSEWSAREVEAMRNLGVGAPSAAQGVGAPQSTGPGNQVITQVPAGQLPVPGRPAGGTGPGSRLTFGGGGPFKPVLADQVTHFKIGGWNMYPHLGTSNMAEVEDRWGDAEFLSPAWFASWTIAGNDVMNNLDSSNGGPLRMDRIGEIPSQFGGVLSTLGDGFLNTRAGMRDPFGPDHPTPGFSGGGF